MVAVKICIRGFRRLEYMRFRLESFDETQEHTYTVTRVAKESGHEINVISTERGWVMPFKTVMLPHRTAMRCKVRMHF